jgi:hypothetical protein
MFLNVANALAGQYLFVNSRTENKAGGPQDRWGNPEFGGICAFARRVISTLGREQPELLSSSGWLNVSGGKMTIATELARQAASPMRLKW